MSMTSLFRNLTRAPKPKGIDDAPLVENRIGLEHPPAAFITLPAPHETPHPDPVPLTASPSSQPSPSVTAFIWIDRAPREWIETLVRLARIRQISKIYLGGDNRAIRLEGSKFEWIDGQLTDAMAAILATGTEQFLFVVSPILASLDAFDHAVAWMDDDPRIATVSFLSNSAGALSFPHRNTETPFGVDGHDESTLTQRLRARKPKQWGPVPLPVAEGGAVLVSRSALEVAGGLNDHGTQSAAYTLAEFSLRASRRGFNNFLDPYTYVTRPWDGTGPYPSVLANPEARHSLHQRHHFFPNHYDAERTSASSVLAESLDVARAKALGLRILIDGSALGPKEMGTQVLTVQLTAALAAHPDVQRVVLGVPDPTNIPAYARKLRAEDKVSFVASGDLEFADAPNVDVIHRPFQPTGSLPWDRWRSIAKRAVITIQDLIAYRNGAYFQGYDEWAHYRKNLAWQTSQADAIFGISHDVADVIREERLSVDAERLFVVENGANQRSKDEPARIPSSFILRGWSARPFLLVIGATYAHKNRDLAIRVWLRLKRKGFKPGLVLAGAAVPFGSTRIEEAELAQAMQEADVDDILQLPDISAEERNWLLRNASVVLYLTAAEGFGLVPFEAASVGVPTLHISFGPLRELIEDNSVPTSYDIDILAERAEQLLSDPAVAARSVQRALQSIDRYSWTATACKAVDAYFETLSRPSRQPRS